MNATKLTVAGIAVIFTAFGWLGASGQESTRVLFVGNSYTGGIKRAQLAMLRQQGIRAKLEFLSPGGKTLDWHVKSGTLAKIKSGHYDIVVLQEQSQTPAYSKLRKKFVAACKTLADEVRQSGGRPVLYMTWGRRDGDRQNRRLAPTFEKMQGLLSQGYREAAKNSKSDVVPVGEVWAAIRRADLELAKKMYQGDGSHPSELGAFVTSLTFTCHLFNRKPDEVPAPDPLRLSEQQLKVIRSAVRSTLK